MVGEGRLQSNFAALECKKHIPRPHGNSKRNLTQNFKNASLCDGRRWRTSNEARYPLTGNNEINTGWTDQQCMDEQTDDLR